MIIPVIVGVFVVLAVGVPATALGVFVEHLERGRRCAPAPVWRAWLKPLAARTAGLWSWLDTAQAPVPAPRRPVNGRYLGTQPRRTPRPGPFTAVDMPACPEPEPGPAWGDPGDGLGPDVPLVRPWSPEIAYGVDRCEIDVAEAERQFALAMGPEGCEQA
jgi:hypothetical protein